MSSSPESAARAKPAIFLAQLARRALWLLAAASPLVVAPGLAAAHPGAVDAKGCHVDSRSARRRCHGASTLEDLSRTPRSGDEGVFHGPLVRVIDGDSLEAQIQGVVMEFRLAEIDAPEYDQPYGPDAKRLLEELIGERTLVLAPFDIDSYGRTVAHVWAGDVQLNRELVIRGAAWFLSDFTLDETLYYVEQEAREAKRGLWALPAAQRVEPWEWRKRRSRRRR
ncbi:MAG TPA: thermonuclease family protein [Steroidobacter sp.]|jgi:micrococcal nuclease|nr:thermonuclease family protein [Steroidobacteraceae bacterium]HLS82158.1 thermonuclease family protein [Steroidobacter sp.]